MRLRSVVAVTTRPEIEAALASEADAILVAVNDATVPSTEARRRAQDAIAAAHEVSKAALAVVNHPRTGLMRDDLEAVVSDGLGAVLLPHANEPQNVRDLAVGLREFEYERGIEPGEILAFPVIETARGLLRAAETAMAAPRVAGLVFGAEAYAADVGGRHEELGARLSYARGAVVAAARHVDGVALIATYPYQARDLAQQGFSGVIIGEPGGVTTVNAAMTPDGGTVARARAQIAAYEEARRGDLPVARLGEQLVDVHTVRKARQILEWAGEA